MRVLVYRDDLVESSHNIHYVVVDKFGQTICSAGNQKLVTFWRSAAKPLQLLPLVEEGGADQLGLDTSHLAVMSSSHNGQKEHTQKVREILDKLGLPESALQCGVHLPWDDATARELLEKGQQPGPIHTNCSGKHANLLALCQHMHVDNHGYHGIDHPIQQRIFQEIQSFTGLSKIKMAVDGCGVPVYALPLERMAWAYALMASPEELPLEKGKAVGRITQAMVTHPLLVAGTGRFDTELMEEAQGELFAKCGAEGVFCIGIPDKGYGLALKVEDGHSRAYGPSVMMILEKLGILKQKLPQWRNLQIKNHRGESVGYLQGED